MSTTTARQATLIDRIFDSYLVYYDSVDLGDPTHAGTKCKYHATLEKMKNPLKVTVEEILGQSGG